VRHTEAISDELDHPITAWADEIIQSAKRLMFEGQAYLIAVSGQPWYCQNGDAWIDNSWWIDTARSRYERFKSSSNHWLIDELEILTCHFPSQYGDAARLRIEQWYEDSAHDPEDWWGLTAIVHPQHPIFRDLYECPPGNDSERALLASLGYESVAADLRKNLLVDHKHRDWFSVSDTLLRIFTTGGSSLIKLIISDKELQRIQQSFELLATKDIPNSSLLSEPYLSEKLGQSSCIRTAALLGWQNVIDCLSKNKNYLESLDAYDLLWWSLTGRKQLVENKIAIAAPHVSLPKTLSSSHICSEPMAMAIAWKRAQSKLHFT